MVTIYLMTYEESCVRLVGFALLKSAVKHSEGSPFESADIPIGSMLNSLPWPMCLPTQLSISHDRIYSSSKNMQTYVGSSS